MLGKIEDRSRRHVILKTEDEMVEWHNQLNGHGFDQLWEMVMDRGAWHAVVHGVTKSWT